MGLTDSTQTRARELLNAQEPPPFLVTAAEQTAGRGRIGRQWISPPGNFYGSLVVRTSVPPQRYGEYSFLTAVALHSAVMESMPGNFTLKWPNDILLNGRKCAGILIESENEHLIIGMGVNLRHAPPDDVVNVPAAALWPDAPVDAARDQAFAECLVKNFAAWHRQYEQQGFELVRAAWLAAAHGFGQSITVKTPQKTLTGIFVGIDAQGNLLLTRDAETIKITTADVLFS